MSLALSILLKVVKFDENQPRDDHGRWSETGAGGAGETPHTMMDRESTPFDGPSPEAISSQINSAILLRESNRRPLGEHASVEQIKGYLNRHVRERFGRVLDPDDPKDVEIAEKQAAAEVEWQRAHGNGEANWYTKDVKSAFDLTTEVMPQLADPVNRQLFTVVAGIMSPQNDPVDNWRQAASAMKEFFRSGGEAVPSINPDTGGLWAGTGTKRRQIDMLNNMIKAHGGVKEAMNYLFDEHLVSDLHNDRREYGGFTRNTVRGKATDKRIGLAIFGPKVGVFVGNMNGVDGVTVDLWQTRTYNRWFGRLDTSDRTDVPSASERRAITSMVVKIAQERGLKPQSVQASLWHFEQNLYKQLGAKSAKAYYFSDGARKFVAQERERQNARTDGAGGTAGVQTRAGGSWIGARRGDALAGLDHPSARGQRVGVVYIDKVFNESQPRDDHGRWSETGGSAVNSLGKPIASTPEGLKNFHEWFGDSKAVDKQGRPLVLYHGTMDDFSRFNPKATEDGAFHFGTPKAAWDAVYQNPAYEEDVDDSGNAAPAIPPLLMPVYLSVKNPMRVKDQDSDWAETIAEAKRKGHDGLVYKNAHEDKGKDSYAVFSPTQIKSATGNNGKFNPKNPDITKGAVYLPRLADNLRKRFNPGQPRNADGEWSSTGGGSSGANPDPTRGKPTGFTEVSHDNPGGDWEQHDRDYAEQEYKKGRKVVGSPTAELRGRLPTSMVAALPGLNDEQYLANILDDHKAQAIRDSIKAEGVKEAIFVNVNHRGEAFINEGNHRAALASHFRQESVPVTIAYFAGGEKIERKFNLDALVKVYGRIEKTKAFNESQPRDDHGRWSETGGSAVNSLGKPVASTPEGIKNFNEWFAGSKIVDGQGRPLVVYHGTQSDVSTFESRDGAFYFARTPEGAEGEGRGAPPQWMNEMTGIDLPTPAGANVMPVYLAIRKPASAADVNRVAPNARTMRESIPALKAAGFDGYMNDYEIVAFKPTQIKSAVGNRGTFDPKSPDITKRFNENQPRNADGEWTSTGAAGAAPKERIQTSRNEDDEGFYSGELGQIGPISGYKVPDTSSHPVFRVSNHQEWGASHRGSMAVTGEAAEMMGVSGYERDSENTVVFQNLASKMLTTIHADSNGSEETLYHGFQNTRKIEWKVGETFRLPLVATCGDAIRSSGYGISMYLSSQRGRPTLFKFPVGTQMVGYVKWNKGEAKEEGHVWAEAVVAGEFKVVSVKTEIHPFSFQQTNPGAKRPEVDIVTLKQVGTFNPATKKWDKR